jgi:MarR family transcriptional regulator, organic hydroperoxide resistance regulator
MLQPAPDQSSARREPMEMLLAADVRVVTAESDHIGRVFADRHVGRNELRALVHVSPLRRRAEPSPRAS